MSKDTTIKAGASVAKHDKDTGSTAVQIVNLSERIATLAKHLETNRKDKHSTRGLLQMVADRRKLVTYLKRKNPEQWENVAEKAGLKK